jgi:stage V sporulation protein K
MDYSITELVKIAEIMVGKRQYKLSPDARQKIALILNRKIQSNDYRMGNARLVRNLVESSIRKQAVRLVNKKVVLRDDLITLKGEDFIDQEIPDKSNFSSR